MNNEFQKLIDRAKDFDNEKDFKNNKEEMINFSIYFKYAKQVCNEKKIIFCGENYYEYVDGFYRQLSENFMKRIIIEVLKESLDPDDINQILYFIKVIGIIEIDQLNGSDLLNLKNGLFDVHDYSLKEHTDKNYSTVQLDVNYDPNSKCELWDKSVNEIFEGDQEKIFILQEYFGYCLTRQTKYEKALFLLGDGANGKSVVLHILEKLIGKENCSSVPLERFDRTCYIAELFGKAVNLSIETNAKSEVYDSTFKAIVSGDTISADQKYKKPFKFKPFCKLIIATNNLPRVDDRTNAFFRRLLILTFNVDFRGKENKELKHQLEAELNGIFSWALEGLKRLIAQKGFTEAKAIKDEICEYKRTNNPLILFIEDVCTLHENAIVAKAVVYQHYKDWCISGGYHPMSKIHFGKGLLRILKEKIDPDARDSNGEKAWRGLSTILKPNPDETKKILDALSRF